jgi:xanthine dehydrogenase YagS FAD-binding subunit
MELFSYSKAANVTQAINIVARASTAQQGAEIRFLAGGTTLLDLMKLNVERPTHLVDINHLPLDIIEKLPDGCLKIGALVRNADLAHHPIIIKSYPVLSQALLQGASAQLRNKATTAGNLLQRTRCMYFRNEALACNKRLPGSGCSALEGDNRSLAILGTSKSCIATNPSDMNVALAALEATIQIQGPNKTRDVSIEDFFLLPKDSPHRENILGPGDLVTSVTLPPPRTKSLQIYLKLRDRASYEFALASAAVVLELKQQRIAFVRIALGGVGSKPWRSFEAEEILHNQAAHVPAFNQAAQAALSNAIPQSHNGFKIELARRCLSHALTLAVKSA